MEAKYNPVDPAEIQPRGPETPLITIGQSPSPVEAEMPRRAVRKMAARVSPFWRYLRLQGGLPEGGELKFDASGHEVRICKGVITVQVCSDG